MIILSTVLGNIKSAHINKDNSDLHVSITMKIKTSPIEFQDFSFSFIKHNFKDYELDLIQNLLENKKDSFSLSFTFRCEKGEISFRNPLHNTETTFRDLTLISYDGKTFTESNSLGKKISSAIKNIFNKF